jgi:hypothetical protein
MVRRFYEDGRAEVRSLIPLLQEMAESDREALNKDYVDPDRRAELNQKLQKVNSLLEVIQSFEPVERDTHWDLNLIQINSMGNIIAYYLRFSAPTLLDELGFDLSISERARALITTVLRRTKPARVADYVPASREPKPNEVVLRRIQAALRELGGREPSEVLVNRIWNAPLVRRGLYDSEWGRFELYWELIQRNPEIDIQDDKQRIRVALVIDKLEELLLRPAPVAINAQIQSE